LRRRRARARRFARARPRSLGLVKRELLRNGIGELAEALALEAELQGVAGATTDFAEAHAAFGEKRAQAVRGI
jgi:enoyl-CoA hydratase/carnithine racemase